MARGVDNYFLKVSFHFPPAGETMNKDLIERGFPRSWSFRTSSVNQVPFGCYHIALSRARKVSNRQQRDMPISGTLTINLFYIKNIVRYYLSKAILSRKFPPGLCLCLEDVQLLLVLRSRTLGRTLT